MASLATRHLTDACKSGWLFGLAAWRFDGIAPRRANFGAFASICVLTHIEIAFGCASRYKPSPLTGSAKLAIPNRYHFTRQGCRGVIEYVCFNRYRLRRGDWHGSPPFSPVGYHGGSQRKRFTQLFIGPIALTHGSDRPAETRRSRNRVTD